MAGVRAGLAPGDGSCVRARPTAAPSNTAPSAPRASVRMRKRILRLRADLPLSFLVARAKRETPTPQVFLHQH